MKVFLAVFSCLAALVLGGDPTIPRWGGNNELLAWSALVNMTSPSGVKQEAHWQFDYYYDASGASTVSRYDHHEGQDDEVIPFCTSEVTMGKPVTNLNSADGLYIIWKDGVTNEDKCCNCTAKALTKGMPNFVVRSDWMRRGNATYIGKGVVNGKDVDGWRIQGMVNGANYYYATADDAKYMVVFNETVQHDQVEKRWDIVSLTPSTPPASKFTPPSGCSKAC